MVIFYRGKIALKFRHLVFSGSLQNEGVGIKIRDYPDVDPLSCEKLPLEKPTTPNPGWIYAQCDAIGSAVDVTFQSNSNNSLMCEITIFGLQRNLKHFKLYQSTHFCIKHRKISADTNPKFTPKILSSFEKTAQERSVHLGKRAF